MRRKPHAQRWRRGQYCVDVHVTSPEGTELQFHTSDGMSAPVGVANHALRAIAVALGIPIEAPAAEPMDSITRDKGFA